MRITRRYGAMATLAGAAEFSLGSHALSPQLAGRTAAEQRNDKRHSEGDKLQITFSLEANRSSSSDEDDSGSLGGTYQVARIPGSIIIELRVPPAGFQTPLTIVAALSGALASTSASLAALLLLLGPVGLGRDLYCHECRGH